MERCSELLELEYFFTQRFLGCAWVCCHRLLPAQCPTRYHDDGWWEVQERRSSCSVLLLRFFSVRELGFRALSLCSISKPSGLGLFWKHLDSAHTSAPSLMVLLRGQGRYYYLDGVPTVEISQASHVSELMEAWKCPPEQPWPEQRDSHSTLTAGNILSSMSPTNC